MTSPIITWSLPGYGYKKTTLFPYSDPSFLQLAAKLKSNYIVLEILRLWIIPNHACYLR